MKWIKDFQQDVLNKRTKPVLGFISKTLKESYKKMYWEDEKWRVQKEKESNDGRTTRTKVVLYKGISSHWNNLPTSRDHLLVPFMMIYVIDTVTLQKGFHRTGGEVTRDPVSTERNSTTNWLGWSVKY